MPGIIDCCKSSAKDKDEEQSFDPTDDMGEKLLPSTAPPPPQPKICTSPQKAASTITVFTALTTTATALAYFEPTLPIIKLFAKFIDLHPNVSLGIEITIVGLNALALILGTYDETEKVPDMELSTNSHLSEAIRKAPIGQTPKPTRTTDGQIETKSKKDNSTDGQTDAKSKKDDSTHGQTETKSKDDSTDGQTEKNGYDWGKAAGKVILGAGGSSTVASYFFDKAPWKLVATIANTAYTAGSEWILPAVRPCFRK